MAARTFPIHLLNHTSPMTLTSLRRTPIGQAIGLALHTSYNPDSEPGLLLVGIMNAISAGLLIYASLTELLVEDFAIGMSLVGAWA
jgi:zinc transporter ZupT